ncbi:MAG: 2-oxoglutarate dehydrogenase complex dihydrolipoyllysine-residue succinyltransferase [Rhodospirillales bacterium]
MAIEIKVPALGESVSEATVAKWFKAAGDTVAADEPLVELETDKVTLEVNSPAAGVLGEITAPVGTDVAVGALLGTLNEGAEGGKASAPKPIAAPSPAPETNKPAPPPSPAPARAADPAVSAGGDNVLMLSPAVRRLIEENRLDPRKIPASGKDGRLTKGDVVAYIGSRGSSPEAKPASTGVVPFPTPAAQEPTSPSVDGREERVRMTRLRKMIAQRLKDAQNTAAMLTTFNEVDMTAANNLRARYKDAFEKKHGARLGVMSLFVKACVIALREFPAINAEVDGDDIVYKNHYDIAIAVSSPQGLVVPVVCDCDALSFAAIEAKISDLGKRAREGRLAIEDMQGGTFTITNGGVFGSLMSTPIINPPQSGILGMHKIQQRPMVMPDGSIAARPMMYVALSYDHRIVDGREAVSFLVRVKECVEAPERILIET